MTVYGEVSAESVSAVLYKKQATFGIIAAACVSDDGVMFQCVDWQANCLAGVTSEDGFFTKMTTVMTCHPWIFWIGGVNAFIHFCWVGTLLMCQLYQV